MIHFHKVNYKILCIKSNNLILKVIINHHYKIQMLKNQSKLILIEMIFLHQL